MRSIFSALLGAGLLTGVLGAQGQPKPVVFYLHGRIIEEQGPDAVSPEFGPYRYYAIVDSLRASGFTVLADLRPRGADVEAEAVRIAHRVDSVLKTGVPPGRVFVVGFSKGGGIAIRASARLRRTDVGFVFMGACGTDGGPEAVVAGRILSLYERSDSLGQGCQKMLSRAATGSKYEEKMIDTGKKHGAFYLPRPEWLDPLRAWIRKTTSP